MKKIAHNTLKRIGMGIIICLAIYGLHTAHLDVACYSHQDGIADLIEELG